MISPSESTIAGIPQRQIIGITFLQNGAKNVLLLSYGSPSPIFVCFYSIIPSARFQQPALSKKQPFLRGVKKTAAFLCFLPCANGPPPAVLRFAPDAY